jgi:hypothetical protein
MAPPVGGERLRSAQPRRSISSTSVTVTDLSMAISRDNSA